MQLNNFVIVAVYRQITSCYSELGVWTLNVTLISHQKYIISILSSITIHAQFFQTNLSLCLILPLFGYKEKTWFSFPYMKHSHQHTFGF